MGWRDRYPAQLSPSQDCSCLIRSMDHPGALAHVLTLEYSVISDTPGCDSWIQVISGPATPRLCGNFTRRFEGAELELKLHTDVKASQSKGFLLYTYGKIYELTVR